MHFELGGKSANIVFADADLERAVDGSLVNMFSNNGQICIAGSRVLVQRAIADEFTERFVKQAEERLLPYLDDGIAERFLSIVGFRDEEDNAFMIMGLAPWEERTRSQQEIVAEMNRLAGQVVGVRPRRGHGRGRVHARAGHQTRQRRSSRLGCNRRAHRRRDRCGQTSRCGPGRRRRQR